MAALHARTHPTLDVDGCFGCKAASVSPNFSGVPQGRAEWHGPTVNQRREAIERQAKAEGREIRPRGGRPYAGPVSV
jgi:hypothetical protein